MVSSHRAFFRPNPRNNLNHFTSAAGLDKPICIDVALPCRDVVAVLCPQTFARDPFLGEIYNLVDCWTRKPYVAASGSRRGQETAFVYFPVSSYLDSKRHDSTSPLAWALRNLYLMEAPEVKYVCLYPC